MSAASSASTRTKPFLFERSFDDPSKVYLPGEKFGPQVKVDLPKPKSKSGEKASGNETEEPAAPPPPPPKTFTEAELEAAREEGYVEGHTSALEEAETAREHYVADALNVISQSLDGLEEQQSEANREIGETALRLVYAVIEKVVPAHAQAHATESVEALVRDVLPLVYDEPSLMVSTHNMITEAVQSRLDEVVGRSNFRGSVTVTPDYELQPGDCRVDWQGGGADRSEGRLWNDIRAIMAENIGPVDVDALDAEADAETQAAVTPEDTHLEGAAPDASLQEEQAAEPEVTEDATKDDLYTAPEADPAQYQEDHADIGQEPEQLAVSESLLNHDDDAKPLES